jgi:hypothetical protein
VVLVVALRLAVFGSWAPNPVLAKSSFPPALHRMVDGARYVADMVREAPVLVLLALLGLLLAHQRVRALWPAWVLALGAMGLVVPAGGDWMEGYRFLVPVVPLLAVLLIHSVDPRVLAARPWVPAAAALICGVTSVAYLVAQSPTEARGRHTTSLPITELTEVSTLDGQRTDASTALMLLNAQNQRDLVEVLPYLSERIPELSQELGRPPVILTGQIGLIPYYVQTRIGTAHFIDRYGLTDWTIAHSKRPRVRPGVLLTYEDIFAGPSTPVAEYVRSTDPDLIYDLYVLPFHLEDMKRLLEPLGYRLELAGGAGGREIVGREGHLWVFSKIRESSPPHTRVSEG